MEAAQLCLVNVSALGTEILKNIVLPGIGGFTIVDSGIVTEEDIGCKWAAHNLRIFIETYKKIYEISTFSFFLFFSAIFSTEKKKKNISFFFDTNSIGQSKAKCSMQLLQELNPDVRSDYLDESIEMVLDNNPEYFHAFNVVIASSLKEKTLLKLSRMLWSQNIPFVYCRSIGCIASARLQYKEHFVIETHPDNKQSDLRLVQPFEMLEKYLDVCLQCMENDWISFSVAVVVFVDNNFFFFFRL